VIPMSSPQMTRMFGFESGMVPLPFVSENRHDQDSRNRRRASITLAG